MSSMNRENCLNFCLDERSLQDMEGNDQETIIKVEVKDEVEEVESTTIPVSRRTRSAWKLHFGSEDSAGVMEQHNEQRAKKSFEVKRGAEVDDNVSDEEWEVPSKKSKQLNQAKSKIRRIKLKIGTGKNSFVEEFGDRKSENATTTEGWLERERRERRNATRRARYAKLKEDKIFSEKKNEAAREVHAKLRQDENLREKRNAAARERYAKYKREKYAKLREDENRCGKSAAKRERHVKLLEDSSEGSLGSNENVENSQQISTDTKEELQGLDGHCEGPKDTSATAQQEKVGLVRFSQSLNMTPEERQKMKRERDYFNRHARLACMSREERKRKNERAYFSQQARLASMSREERQKMQAKNTERMREKVRNFTPEQLQKYREQTNKSMQRFLDKLRANGELEGHKEKMRQYARQHARLYKAKMTPEEKLRDQRGRKISKIKYRLRKKGKSEEEIQQAVAEFKAKMERGEEQETRNSYSFISCETPEQRERRLQRNRNYLARLKLKREMKEAGNSEKEIAAAVAALKAELGPEFEETLEEEWRRLQEATIIKAVDTLERDMRESGISEEEIMVCVNALKAEMWSVPVPPPEEIKRDLKSQPKRLKNRYKRNRAQHRSQESIEQRRKYAREHSKIYYAMRKLKKDMVQLGKSDEEIDRSVKELKRKMTIEREIEISRNKKDSVTKETEMVLDKSNVPSARTQQENLEVEETSCHFEGPEVDQENDEGDICGNYGTFTDASPSSSDPAPGPGPIENYQDEDAQGGPVTPTDLVYRPPEIPTEIEELAPSNEKKDTNGGHYHSKIEAEAMQPSESNKQKEVVKCQDTKPFPPDKEIPSPSRREVTEIDVFQEQSSGENDPEDSVIKIEAEDSDADEEVHTDPLFLPSESSSSENSSLETSEDSEEEKEEDGVVLTRKSKRIQNVQKDDLVPTGTKKQCAQLNGLANEEKMVKIRIRQRLATKEIAVAKGQGNEEEKADLVHKRKRKGTWKPEKLSVPVPTQKRRGRPPVLSKEEKKAKHNAKMRRLREAAKELASKVESGVELTAEEAEKVRKKRISIKTPEEIEVEKKRKREVIREWRRNLAPEKKAKITESIKKYQAQAKYKIERRSYEKRKHANETPEARQRRLERVKISEKKSKLRKRLLAQGMSAEEIEVCASALESELRMKPLPPLETLSEYKPKPQPSGIKRVKTPEEKRRRAERGVELRRKWVENLTPEKREKHLQSLKRSQQKFKLKKQLQAEGASPQEIEARLATLEAQMKMEANTQTQKLSGQRRKNH